MRGPFDDAIEQQQQSSVATTGRSRETKRRPPGGKPLMRLLQLLESAGFNEAASTAVDAAIAGPDRDSFRASAREFTAAPGGDLSGAAPARRGRRGRAASGE